MQFTITGIREGAMGRGIVPFSFCTEAASEEEALAQCRLAYASYDVLSGTVVQIPAELGDVQIVASGGVTQTQADVPPVAEASEPQAAEAAQPEAEEDLPSDA